MQIASFKDMYLSELQELASVEGQLAESLLHMAEVASHPTLKNALLHHREETQVQKDRLEPILQKHGGSSKAHTDQAMEALLKETGKMLTLLKGKGLIGSAQKLEHYEIAAYGTAAALAGQLDLRDDQQMLHASPEEERHADALLTQLEE